MELIKIENKGFSQASYQEGNKGFQKVVNCFIDNNGYFTTRGGLTSITTTGVVLPNFPIDGLFYWQNRNVTMIVCEGNLYEMSANNVIIYIGNNLEVNKRASFAVVRTSSGVESLAVANYGDIFMYDPVNSTYTNLYTTDNDCPRNVKKIVFLDGYIIALPNNSSKFYWSTISDPEDWSALSFASAEGRADNLETLFVKGFYLFLVGTETIETYYNVGGETITFQRLDGSMIENGTFTGDSFENVKDNLIFLDSKRRLCRVTSGTDYEILSTPIEKYLNDIVTITDAYAFPMEYQGRSFYCLTFPTDNKTLMFDIGNGQFYEWGVWNATFSNYDKLPIFSASYNGKIQKQFLGSSENDHKIFVLEQNSFDDDGSNIKKEILTGHLDFGTLSQKRLNKTRLNMKKGNTNPCVIQYNHRKNSSEWQENNSISLSTGEGVTNNSSLQINKCLIFNNIQMKFVSDSNSEFCIGDISLQIDLLETKLNG